MLETLIQAIENGKAVYVQSPTTKTIYNPTFCNTKRLWVDGWFTHSAKTMSVSEMIEDIKRIATFDTICGIVE